MATSAAAVGGVILAGGRGRRMGGADKGWVSFEGRPLVEHVRARLAPQVAALAIVANRNLERYRTLGATVVSDDTAHFDPFSGPLVGMLEGLRHCPLPWTVFVPCDAPSLPLDLVSRLWAAGAGRPALASVAGRRQPVFCLLPTAAAPQLLAALQAGERRPDDFLRRLGAVELAFEDAAAFRNVNVPEAAP